MGKYNLAKIRDYPYLNEKLAKDIQRHAEYLAKEGERLKHLSDQFKQILFDKPHKPE